MAPTHEWGQITREDGQNLLTRVDHVVINTITSPELWAYASRVTTGNDMRQRLNQGQASLHGLCTFLFVSEGQIVNAR
jgi:hypothetical protein